MVEVQKLAVANRDQIPNFKMEQKTLEYVVFRGYISTLEYLESLEQPLDGYELTEEHLQIAVKKGHLNVVKWLIDVSERHERIHPSYIFGAGRFSCEHFPAKEIMGYLKDLAYDFPEISDHVSACQFKREDSRFPKEVTSIAFDMELYDNEFWETELDDTLEQEADYEIERDKTYKKTFK